MAQVEASVKLYRLYAIRRAFDMEPDFPRRLGVGRAHQKQLFSR
jgi:hypothetical protein